MTNPITVNSTKTVTSIIRNGTAIEKMMLAWEWQPQGLFLGDVQAAWYDPIDTANDDWRRNLLTWSEDFTNAIWQKYDVTVPPTQYLAPDGTLTADKLVEFTTTTQHQLRNPTTATANTVHTVSLYAKASERFLLRLGLFNGTISSGAFAQFNLSTGEISGQTTTGTATNVSYSISNVGVANGFYRCSVTATVDSSSTSISPFIGVLDASGNAAYTGNGTSGIEIWGAQLELGSVATPYQRITDVNTEVRALFPNNTMFQDSVVLAPNAAASSSQTVGMWLDKSKLLALGPNLFLGLVTQAWVPNAGSTITNESSYISNGTAGVIKTGLLAIGKSYKVSYNISASVGAVRFQNQNIAGAGTVIHETRGLGGTSLFIFTATAAGLFLRSTTAGDANITVNSLDIQELPGNHALQTSTSLRPLFGRSPVSRRNMFTFSESFDNAAWTKSGVTVTKNAAGSSGSSNTAWTVASTSTSGQIRRTISNASLLTTYTYSVVAKAGTANWLLLQGVLWTTPGNAGAWFNLADGTIGIVNTGFTATREAVGNGFYRCSITFTTGSTDSVGDAWAYIVSSDGNTTTSVGQTLIIEQAQFEAGSVATPYQKVVSALDMTEAGKPSYAFIRPDLSDDKLTTNMASTKNVQRYSEEFDLWSKRDSATVLLNTVIAPDGLVTADTLVSGGGIQGSVFLGPYAGTGNFLAGSSISCFVKAGTSSIAYVYGRESTPEAFAVYNLSSKTLIASSGGTPSLTEVGNGWFRIGLDNITSAANYFVVGGKDVYVSGSPWGVGTWNVGNTIHIWGAQLEKNSTVTPYEHGGFKGDILVAGKNGSVFQSDVVSPTGVMDLGPLTYTGGTPGILRAVGDVVGYTMARKKFSDVEKAQLVRYYKKRGAKGILILGPELITNGNFSNGSTGWTFSPATISNGGVSWTTNVFVTQSSPTLLSLGSRFKISFDITSYTSGFVYPYIGGAFQDTNQRGNIVGTYEFIVTITNLVNQTIGVASGNSPTHTVDNISVRELRPEEEW